MNKKCLLLPLQDTGPMFRLTIKDSCAGYILGLQVYFADSCKDMYLHGDNALGTHSWALDELYETDNDVVQFGLTSGVVIVESANNVLYYHPDEEEQVLFMGAIDSTKDAEITLGRA